MSDLETLIDDAEESLNELEATVGEAEDVDSLDDLGDDELDAVFDHADVLVELADELEDALEAIDLSELPEAIDASELLAAIETGEIPEAIAEGEAGDVVELGHVLRAIDLAELWNAADVRELWQAKRDIDETTDGLEDDDGLVGEAVSTVTDEDGEDDGLIDDGREMAEGAAEGMDAPDLEVGGDEFGLDAEDTQAYQTMIQQQALDGLEEFRDALLVTHEKFQQLYEYNREKMRRTDKSTHSRNPTAVSTITIDRSDLGSTERYSTVPRQVKYSTAPGHDRIYGSRFERELEKRRGESG